MSATINLKQSILFLAARLAVLRSFYFFSFFSMCFSFCHSFAAEQNFITSEEFFCARDVAIPVVRFEALMDSLNAKVRKNYGENWFKDKKIRYGSDRNLVDYGKIEPLMKGFLEKHGASTYASTYEAVLYLKAERQRNQDVRYRLYVKAKSEITEVEMIIKHPELKTYTIDLRGGKVVYRFVSLPDLSVVELPQSATSCKKRYVLAKSGRLFAGQEQREAFRVSGKFRESLLGALEERCDKSGDGWQVRVMADWAVASALLRYSWRFSDFMMAHSMPLPFLRYRFENGIVDYVFYDYDLSTTHREYGLALSQQVNVVSTSCIPRVFESRQSTWRYNDPKAMYPKTISILPGGLDAELQSLSKPCQTSHCLCEYPGGISVFHEQMLATGVIFDFEWQEDGDCDFLWKWLQAPQDCVAKRVAAEELVRKMGFAPQKRLLCGDEKY